MNQQPSMTDREALELAKRDFDQHLKDGLNNTQVDMVLKLAEKYMDETDQLRMELEGVHYALKVIQMGEWACTYDEQGLEVWTTRRINPGQIAREALAAGQEEGGKDE